MQLASIVRTQPVHSPAVASHAPAQAPFLAPFARAAAPTAPLASETARDGAAHLDLPPIVQFPGIEAGQVFDVVKGSKVGFFNVKGEANVLRMDPNAASFHVRAGALGVKVDVQVDIVQVDATTVRITSTGSGVPNMSELGRVVESRPDYAVFEQISDPSKQTIIAHDGAGTVTIDTVVPTLGDAHLVLERR